jgi:hypothetical protein
MPARNWVDLDVVCRRIGPERHAALSDILRSGRHKDLMTGVLLAAPPDRLRLLRLNPRPSHLEEILWSLARGTLEFIPENRLLAVLCFDGDRSTKAETCAFGQIRVNWPIIEAELEARGWHRRPQKPGTSPEELDQWMSANHKKLTSAQQR